MSENSEVETVIEVKETQPQHFYQFCSTLFWNLGRAIANVIQKNFIGYDYY